MVWPHGEEEEGSSAKWNHHQQRTTGGIVRETKSECYGLRNIRSISETFFFFLFFFFRSESLDFSVPDRYKFFGRSTVFTPVRKIPTVPAGTVRNRHCEGWRTKKTFSLKQKSEIKRKHSKKSFSPLFFPIMNIKINHFNVRIFFQLVFIFN